MYVLFNSSTSIQKPKEIKKRDRERAAKKTTTLKMDVFPSAWFGNTKEHLGYIFAWFSYAFSFFFVLSI